MASSDQELFDPPRPSTSDPEHWCYECQIEPGTEPVGDVYACRSCRTVLDTKINDGTLSADDLAGTGLNDASDDAQVPMRCEECGYEFTGHRTDPCPRSDRHAERDEETDTTPSRLDLIRSRALTTAQLSEIPAPEPLVAGLLYLDSLAMLYGPSGVGKSFVGVDLAMHVASDAQWWHSCELITGPVLYVAAEGASGIRLRTDAWSTHHQRSDAVIWQPMAINVFDPMWSDALGEYACEIGAVFIIVDTLARSTVGAQENSTQDMGLVVDNLDRVRLATGACVLNVHHAGKDVTAGARGSSALKAAMDTELELSGSTTERMYLKNTKQKNAPELDQLAFKFHVVAGTDSGVIAAASGSADDDELPAAAFDTLQTLRDIEVDGGVSATAWRVAVDASERTFYRHRAGLLKQGFVENIGTEKMPRYQVVCVDE